jgi:hypothetical protein
MRQFKLNSASKLGFALLLLVIVSIVLLAFGVIRPTEWSWTGIGDYTVPKSDALEYHPEKTLWDWLGLLIIPIVLALGGVLFSNAERKQERAIAAERTHNETLRNYLDAMSDLIIIHHLDKSMEGDRVREIARARTLAALRALDGPRRGSVVRFLADARLIQMEKLTEAEELEAKERGKAKIERPGLGRVNPPKVLLTGADLSGADLRGAWLNEVLLTKANLRGANLRGAYLTRAYLWGVDLKYAQLEAANLNCADLTSADLRGATMWETKMNGAILTNANVPPYIGRRAKLKGASISGVALIHKDDPPRLEDEQLLKDAVKGEFDCINGDVLEILS